MPLLILCGSAIRVTGPSWMRLASRIQHSEVCLFSSDWPHVEGGRNPVKRFEDSMRGVGDRARQRFYCDNFVDLMGAGLSAVPRAA